jgi:hypothetical protein
MQTVGLILTVAGAAMQIQQGRQQKAALEGQARAMEVQAEWTKFQGKSKAIKERSEAAKSMELTLVQMAAINAAGGAGNMNPLTGNPFGLKIQALDVGATNTFMARDNATIASGIANSQAGYQLYQAGRARAAGKQAMTSAITGAVFTLAAGAFSFARTAGPSGPASPGGGGAIQPSAAPAGYGGTMTPYGGVQWGTTGGGGFGGVSI